MSAMLSFDGVERLTVANLGRRPGVFIAGEHESVDLVAEFGRETEER